ncbi:MAG: methylenetetrahydrofolate--tRNA-(uracil(54)-C(5))-methyltransferase (FADH(2)-oxidizing) TrmFO [Erysipelotrichaceae bacterium]|nr:methylenetetrahydrofolate--tRNA-(uracil(54)-C(5))-methyltransferase (FADH(2)-oxidizing) TrmFO [Erysipelotrichaceae bacterium]
MKEVKVIGAGLAGSEAAYKLARLGIRVKLYEQKPLKKHEAFKTDLFGELICSNSLRSDDLNNAVGLLKQEMRILDSLIMEAADKTRVEAGKSLAVDRLGFSQYITDKINSHPDIEVIHEEVTSIDPEVPTVIAAGPLCDGQLSDEIKKLCGNDYLYFYDAVSPIVEKDSIDFDSAYYKSRYDEDSKGDYINCPLTREEFETFHKAVIEAKKADVHGFDEIYFEGCMPFEEMARRGYETLLFGPMKPVGLEHDGVRPYAVVQLRKDNAIDTLYNIVGFQTHLTFGEQERVLKLIPALRNVSIVRYGVMHRNTYINSPKVLNNKYQMIKYPNVFVAGQISGVEGYVESAASGLYAALCLKQYLDGGIKDELGPDTMIGAMAGYISDESITKLVPMNANFGIFRCDYKGNKKEKKAYYAAHALAEVKEYKEKYV